MFDRIPSEITGSGVFFPGKFWIGNAIFKIVVWLFIFSVAFFFLCRFLVGCILQEICLFLLICQIYWHKGFYSIFILSFHNHEICGDNPLFIYFIGDLCYLFFLFNLIMNFVNFVYLSKKPLTRAVLILSTF